MFTQAGNSSNFSPLKRTARRLCLATVLPLAGFLGGAMVPSFAATEPALRAPVSGPLAVSESARQHQQIIDSNSAYPDQRVQNYVNRIGQQLARNSDRPDIEYTFTVIDSGNINAFAMPGGYVYINRGLLVYLRSEAELAGVLGHEIGHITARHTARQKTAAAGSKLISAAAYVLTGSADLAEASDMAGTAVVRGYGREHELEADRKGAEFMHRTGYDPNVLLDVISVLKDNELYQRRRAHQSGRKPRSYHGLFATHPRNDARLLEVIGTASKLPPVPRREVNPAEFRDLLNGMPFGKRARTSQRDAQRFYHNKLQFSFVKPERWTVHPGSKAIVSEADDGSAKVTLTIKRRDRNATMRGFLATQLRAEAAGMIRAEPLKQAGLMGYSAIAPADGRGGSRRLAVIYRGNIAYLFEGEAAQEADFPIKDAYFQALIGSFRPMKKSEARSPLAHRIEYIQAKPDTTWAQLARYSKIPDAENQLRLLNAQYPRGEPRAGDWIKVLGEVRPQ